MNPDTFPPAIITDRHLFCAFPQVFDIAFISLTGEEDLLSFKALILRNRFGKNTNGTLQEVILLHHRSN